MDYVLEFAQWSSSPYPHWSTRHTFNQIKWDKTMLYYMENGKKSTLVWVVTYTKYDQGDFWLLAFQPFLARPNFYVFSIQLRFACPLIHPPRTLIFFHGKYMQLQLPPCFGPHAKIHFSTPSWHWRKVTMSSFGLKHWSSPYDVILNFITCARIIVTLFHVSNVFQVIIY